MALLKSYANLLDCIENIIQITLANGVDIKIYLERMMAMQIEVIIDVL